MVSQFKKEKTAAPIRSIDAQIEVLHQELVRMAERPTFYSQKILQTRLRIRALERNQKGGQVNS